MGDIQIFSEIFSNLYIIFSPIHRYNEVGMAKPDSLNDFEVSGKDHHQNYFIHSGANTSIFITTTLRAALNTVELSFNDRGF